MTLSAGNRQMTSPVDHVGSSDLAEVLRSSGVALDDAQVNHLATFRDLLFSANQTMNLTAVRDLPGIERRLILESLRLVAPLRLLFGSGETGYRSLIDLGTGGGLPGLVLAIACPEIHVFLLDATGKKVAFLDRVIQALGLENTTTIHARAEEIGHQPRYRNAFNVVSARAVSTLPALLELGLPLVRPGGHLLLPKGSAIDDELGAGRQAATVLGGEIVSADHLPDVGSTIDTRLVIVRKVAATPTTYPRRPGVPSRSPLGSDESVGTANQRGSDS